MGRHTGFDQAIADIICDRMATGESLRSVCRDKGMPDESSVRWWAVTDVAGFSTQYAKAREAQMEARAEELLEIADDKTGDPQRDRLRVDTRKWIMSKIAPKKYGDKVQIGGDENGVPVRTVFEWRKTES